MPDLQSIHPSVWYAPSAQLYGRVIIGADSSVWPNAVLRAEAHEIRIGVCSNVQDFAMLHIGYKHGISVGDYCSLTHHCTVHGATVEDECLVGIGAVVMDGARIGRGSIVAPGAVVVEGTQVPPHSIVAGVPAKVVRRRDASVENRANALNYRRNADAYRRGCHRVWAADAEAGAL